MRTALLRGPRPRSAARLTRVVGLLTAGAGLLVTSACAQTTGAEDTTTTMGEGFVAICVPATPTVPRGQEYAIEFRRDGQVVKELTSETGTATLVEPPEPTTGVEVYADGDFLGSLNDVDLTSQSWSDRYLGGGRGCPTQASDPAPPSPQPHP